VSFSLGVEALHCNKIYLLNPLHQFIIL